ncbi:MAG: type II secretion system F family protein [Candidatus Woesearchaeota archaeon]
MQNLKKDIQEILKEMRQTLNEIKSAKNNYINVLKELKKIDFMYQNSQIDFKTYTNLKNKILKGNIEEDIIKKYKLYIKELKKKLYNLNKKCFNVVFHDFSYESLELKKYKKEKKGNLDLPNLESLEISEIEEPLEIEIKKIESRKEDKEDILVKTTEINLQEDNLKENKIKPIIKEDLKKNLFENQIKKTDKDFIKKKSFFERLQYCFNSENKPWLSENQKNVFMNGFFSFDFFNYLFFGVEKGRELFGETEIMPTILQYQDKNENVNFSKTELLDPFLLEKEIKELKSLISKKNPEIYKPNSIGYIANMSVRKISIYFIENFPDLFKKLYKEIRYSNMKVLANTYINIMFFFSIIGFLISFPFFTYIYAIQNNNLFSVFLKTIGSSFLFLNLIFWLMFYYPFMISKKRRRSLNTNMPFAIDHMSSIIASGVNPSTMFRLISSSSEYGEVSIEFEKISNYIDFFGYDVLTAVRAVSLNTPSEDFKEFLDGFVSTIETGGNLKDYLKQKSSESLLNYRLERQKYVEALSTYSDIYTGVLIAAPLFFVTSLSLLSVMGGTIAGFRLDTLIALGTYLVIPILNVLFIIFLEINQPEI